jgi:6-pyruvoyltetrahydropterin/6-carboxytetrahydropterin synthase
MQIFKQFTFDSAHFLPHVPEGHKCRNMHGHTYRLVVYLEGPLHPHLQWVEDFAVVKNAIKPVVDQLDHQVMNDIPGLENPTCERIAVWIWERIKPHLPQLKKIELHETPTSGVVYKGNE